MTPEQTFDILTNEVAEIVLEAVKNEFKEQGHNMTGELMNSLKYKIKIEANKAIIEYSLYNYGMVLNYGVTPDRVPYSQGSGAKTSKFIDGLKRFVKLRIGKTGKEGESIAFAIARKMKKEGMPTNNSKTYSKNGRRLNWIGEGINEANPKVLEVINRYMPEIISFYISKAFVEMQKKNSKNITVKIK